MAWTDGLEGDGTHPVALATDVSGTLKHENGGLEADVSAYGGFVLISGGATSAVSGTGSGNVVRATSPTISAGVLNSPDVTTLQVRDSDLSHHYIFGVANIAADRTVSLPLLAGNDTFVFEAFAATLTNKTIDGNSNTLTVLADSQLSGATPIANGGTGQTSKTPAFDALSPTTTKGDLIVSDGTDNVREAVGSNDQVLTADSAQTSGVKWATPSDTKFTEASNTVQTTDATVTTIATIAIPTSKVVKIDIDIVAIKSDLTEAAAYKNNATFRNNAGTVSAVGAMNTLYSPEDDATWVGTSVSVSGTNALVRVAGKAGTTIEWRCITRVMTHS